MGEKHRCRRQIKRNCTRICSNLRNLNSLVLSVLNGAIIVNGVGEIVAAPVRFDLFFFKKSKQCTGPCRSFNLVAVGTAAAVDKTCLLLNKSGDAKQIGDLLKPGVADDSSTRIAHNIDDKFWF